MLAMPICKMNRKIKYISPACKEIFVRYDWPGNLRELYNVIERAVILSNKEAIEPEDLPNEINTTKDTAMTSNLSLGDLGNTSLKDFLNQIEENFLDQALKMSAGNQLKAAELLNEPRHILRYLLKKHNRITREN